MKAPRLERAMQLAIAGIAGAVVGLMIHFPDWSWGPNAAAWVQAVGSVLGILLAIGVPWWQNQRALVVRREDMARITRMEDDRARTMAIKVGEAIYSLRLKCAYLIRSWPEGKPTTHMLGSVEWGASPLDEFEVPSELRESRLELHELHAGAEAAQQAYYHADMAEKFVTAIVSDLQEGEPVEYLEHAIRPQLVRCLIACDAAAREIDQLLD